MTERSCFHCSVLGDQTAIHLQAICTSESVAQSSRHSWSHHKENNSVMFSRIKKIRSDTLTVRSFLCSKSLWECFPSTNLTIHCNKQGIVLREVYILYPIFIHQNKSCFFRCKHQNCKASQRSKRNTERRREKNPHGLWRWCVCVSPWWFSKFSCEYTSWKGHVIVR